MQKKKRFITIGAVIFLSMSICACTKKKEFDAKTYVQASLDACYHGKFADYADLMGFQRKMRKISLKRTSMNGSVSNLMIPILSQRRALLRMQEK